MLLSLRTSAAGEISASIPRKICKPIVRTCKRGKRGGLRRRIKTLRLSDWRKLPPLPTVLLANVQSIRNKLGELEVWAKLKREIKETCLLAFTESWLSDSDRNEDFSLSGFGIPIRLDRFPETTGKSRGERVCLYVNEFVCQLIADVMDIIDLEAALEASRSIEARSRLDAVCPDAPKFVLGDFNRCKLTTVLKT